MDTAAARLAPPRSPLLADRITEALLLAGLPVGYGGHGPGVHLRPAQPYGDSDHCAGLIALHWEPGPRLLAAAAMAQQPASAARDVVISGMQNALAEFLPAFGLEVTLGRPEGETRVGQAADAGHVDVRASAPSGVGPRPQDLGIGAEVVEAVGRAAALAGLPVADHLHAPGITLDVCRPVDDGDDTTGVADLRWNPSRRLSAAAEGDDRAARLRTAVQDAMRHAFGSVLGACGLELRWRRPAHLPYQLRAYGPAAQPPIRH
ncbi:hypothetical protein [Kitasatospora brasiliensis]|uniref:hypothetical protein n=1 Tax=Kitasatospora brasiliensis TaxID=3058040 RepID=UPI00292D382E|nr:hypothetical protein [Kitasatospora sp. K002]